MVTNKHTIPIIGLMLLASLGQAGCTRVEMHFNAYQSHRLPFPEPTAETTIAVVTGTEAEEPFLKSEVADKIARLLRRHGYRLVDQDSAQYLLSAWFGMDSGQTYSGIIPVYEPGEVVSTRIRTSEGRWKSVTTHLPGYTYYMPYSYTVFPKYLSLTLYDRDRMKDDSDEVHTEAIVWRCTNVNADESTDLRWRLNHLLVVCFDYLGRDTKKQRKITLFDNDDRVKALTETPLRN